MSVIDASRHVPSISYVVEKVEVAIERKVLVGGPAKCWVFHFFGRFSDERSAIRGICAIAPTPAEAFAECERWHDLGIPVFRAGETPSGLGGRCSG